MHNNVLIRDSSAGRNALFEELPSFWSSHKSCKLFTDFSSLMDPWIFHPCLHNGLWHVSHSRSPHSFLPLVTESEPGRDAAGEDVGAWCCRRTGSAKTCWHRPPLVPARQGTQGHMLHAAEHYIFISFISISAMFDGTISVCTPHVGIVIPSIRFDTVLHQLGTTSCHVQQSPTKEAMAMFKRFLYQVYCITGHSLSSLEKVYENRWCHDAMGYVRPMRAASTSNLTWGQPQNSGKKTEIVLCQEQKTKSQCQKKYLYP